MKLVRNGGAMAVALALVLASVLDVRADETLRVEVLQKGDDLVGQRLAYAVREQIRKSAGYRDKVGLSGVQLRDLRHEAGSRFEEAGVSVVFVSKILGHTNLSTTSRYLNIHRRGLHAAMQKLEEHRPAVAQPLHTDEANSPATVPPSGEEPASKSRSIQ
jgi:integrase